MKSKTMTAPGNAGESKVPGAEGAQLTAEATKTVSPTRSAVSVLREWSEMIKLEHTVFALPFALSGLLLAIPGLPSWSTVLWTMLAFTGARAAAMTLNRLIDANIDGLNPRTSDRAIPAGRIGKVTAVAFTIGCFALMLFAASKLPPICLWLSPIAVFWLSFYSFTKRFTWLCHLVLGIALGGAALGGWVASSGSLTGFGPWLLALAVSTWVAGFDIIYACQDVDFDRNKKLFSMPSKFGIANALTCSKMLHLVTSMALLGLGLVLDLGPVYYGGVALVCVMLKYEHSLVKADDLSKVNAAFFTTNGIVSIATFLAILIDKLVRMNG